MIDTVLTHVINEKTAGVHIWMHIHCEWSVKNEIKLALVSHLLKSDTPRKFWTRVRWWRTIFRPPYPILMVRRFYNNYCTAEFNQLSVRICSKRGMCTFMKKENYSSNPERVTRTGVHAQKIWLRRIDFTLVNVSMNYFAIGILGFWRRAKIAETWMQKIYEITYKVGSLR